MRGGRGGGGNNDMSAKNFFKKNIYDCSMIYRPMTDIAK